MGEQDKIQMYAQPIDKAAQQMELCLVCYRSLLFFFSCQEKLPEKALVSSSCPGLCRTERWDQTAEEMRARYKLEKGVLPLSHFFSFKGRGIKLKSSHSCFFFSV